MDKMFCDTQQFSLALTFAMCKTRIMQKGDNLIGSAEAAALLGIDRATVTRGVKSGKYTTVGRMPGKTGVYLFDRSYIDALSKSGSEPTRPRSGT